MRFQIAGIRGKADFESVLAHFQSAGGDAILLNPEAVAGKKHLLSAAMHAERAFADGTNRSNSILTEIILYVAWERQIGRAIEKTRPPKGTESFAVITADADFVRLDEIGMVRDDSLLDADPERAKKLGLNDPYLSPEDQAIEMVALTELLKPRCRPQLS